MALRQITYEEARCRMKPGDIIAFSGKGNFSEIIKWATRSSVSHVAGILQTKLLIEGKPQSGMFNQIIESTSLQGFSGVSISRCSERIRDYDGEIWWLPLRAECYEAMDKQAYYNFLIHQNNKPYDVPQAIRSAIDVLDNIPVLGKLTHNTENFDSFFCSELITAALEASGVIAHINASEVTPIDLCSFHLFEDDYYQLKGNEKIIRGYNQTNPVGWGE